MTGFAPELGSVPGPDDVTRVVLDNGIVVLARADFNNLSVTVRGFLLAGSLLDSDAKLGLADFVAGALMRGADNRDFQEIYEALESVGASLDYGGGTHSTGFNGRSLVEDLDLLLGILADTLRRPTFPPDQVERLRAQILTGLALRAQNTGEMAALNFDRLVYNAHPYGRPDEGHPETVQAITNRDLVDFHHGHYGPQGMVIAVVGGIDPQQAVEKVRAALEDWRNPEQIFPPDLPPWTPLPEFVSNRVAIHGKRQSDLIIGTAGPARQAGDYLPAALGNNILGQFGLMGRIGDSVREKAGLAYYAYSGISGGSGPGPWTVSAGVNPANEEKAADLICAEIKRFVTELVTEEEIADSKSNYIGRLPISLESNVGVAGALLTLERFDLGLDYYRRYPDLINAITPKHVLDAAAHYLQPDRLALSIAGPPKNND